MNTDSPISKPSEDRFGYNPIAEHLAPLLVLPRDSPSLIAGVESAWGSGKTSFLNLTRRSLQRTSQDVQVLEYRPWLYSTVDALLLGFCVQVAAQLRGLPGRKYELASKALIGLSKAFGTLRELPNEYGQAAAAAEAGSSALAGAANLLGSSHTIDLSNARSEVQAAIDKTQKPIVIVIDDVDRLAPKEIRLLFQFIKAVADFRGVAYLLAYDPKPVQNALSFGGVLDGREYLKKFVQLPVRLPRLSNLMLRAFFRDAVDSIGDQVVPPFNAVEKEELNGCTGLALFYQCLKTPRDVVRLLNSFLLRLHDCRGEVKLDQLLLFILLDLISPDAVDLVRYHPELFLLPLVHHPEFDILENEGTLSRLMSENKDKAEARDSLLAVLPAEEQPLARKITQHLFDQNEYRDGGYDVRRAQTAHGLIKLLYGGASSLSFSRKDALSFLSGSRRSVIVESVQASGVLPQWIYFLSSVADDADIRNSVGIANVLIGALKREPADSWDSSHRRVADYLAELFGQLRTEADRLRLLRHVSAQRTNLFVSEHFLAKLASDAGLWRDGRSIELESRQASGKPDRVPPARVVDAEQEWLKNVRRAAGADKLHIQPHLGSILHRWGQFNSNDYSEVQGYFAAFCVRFDPLLILQHFPLGSSLDGLEKIVADPGATKEALSRYRTKPELRGTAIKTMEHLQKLSGDKGPPAA